MDTVRPVKRVDAAGSLRLSNEFVGSLRARDGNPLLASPTEAKPPPHQRAASEQARAGRSIVDEVVIPTLQRATRDDMDAREIEALSMLARGFVDLKDANPELAYSVILDILAGINECVVRVRSVAFAFVLADPACRNQAVKQHITTSRGLFPHKRITRRSEMTSKGLVVVEHEEDTSSGHGHGHMSSSSGHGHTSSSSGHGHTPSIASDTPSSPTRKSPIAELLYMRWLEGLKMKWPNILGSAS